MEKTKSIDYCISALLDSTADTVMIRSFFQQTERLYVWNLRFGLSGRATGA